VLTRLRVDLDDPNFLNNRSRNAAVPASVPGIRIYLQDLNLIPSQVRLPPTAMKACLSAGVIGILFSLVPSVLGATYPISETIVGSGFYKAFSFETIDDPTHGRVYAFLDPLVHLWFSPPFVRNYVDQATSQSQNLTFASRDTFILRADFTTTLDASGPGRNSVRIRSNNVYTTHTAVFVSVLLQRFT